MPNTLTLTLQPNSTSVCFTLGDRTWNCELADLEKLSNQYFDLPQNQNPPFGVAQRVFHCCYGDAPDIYPPGSLTFVVVEQNVDPAVLTILRNLPLEHAAIGLAGPRAAISMRGPNQHVVRATSPLEQEDLQPLQQFMRLNLISDVPVENATYQWLPNNRRREAIDWLQEANPPASSFLEIYAHGTWIPPNFWLQKVDENLNEDALEQFSAGLTLSELFTDKEKVPQIVFLGVCNAGLAVPGKPSAAEQLLTLGAKVVIAPNQPVLLDDAIAIGAELAQTFAGATEPLSVPVAVASVLEQRHGINSVNCRDAKSSPWTIHTRVENLTLPPPPRTLRTSSAVVFLVRGEDVGTTTQGSEVVWITDTLEDLAPIKLLRSGDGQVVVSPDGALTAVSGNGNVSVYLLNHLNPGNAQAVTTFRDAGTPLAVARRGHTGVRCIATDGEVTKLLEWDSCWEEARTKEIYNKAAQSGCFVGGAWVLVNEEKQLIGPNVHQNEQTNVDAVFSATSYCGDLLVVRGVDGRLTSTLAATSTPLRTTDFPDSAAAVWLAPDIRLRVNLKPALIVRTPADALVRVCFVWPE